MNTQYLIIANELLPNEMNFIIADYHENFKLLKIIILTRKV